MEKVKTLKIGQVGKTTLCDMAILSDMVDKCCFEKVKNPGVINKERRRVNATAKFLGIKYRKINRA